jgi:hypothetical protein
LKTAVNYPLARHSAKNGWSLLPHGYHGRFTGGKAAGWLEIIWYTPTFGYADDVNIVGGSVHTVRKNA